MSTQNIKRYFNTIHNSLAMTTGNLDYNRVEQAIINLCDCINNTDTDEFVWCIGEGGCFTLDELIIGAYQFAADHHGGQNSNTYKMLSACSSIYTQGAGEDDAGEVYQLLENIYKESL